MRRLLFVPVFFLVAFLFLAPTQLRADGFDFTFSENLVGLGDVTLSWSLPAPTTPDLVYPGLGFSVINVPTMLAVDGGSPTPVTDSFTFFNSAGATINGYVFTDLVQFELAGVGPVFYGDPSSPTFIPGVYHGFDVNPVYVDANGNPDAACLTIVSTPEPSSILLLLMGFLALAGAVSVKKAAA